MIKKYFAMAFVLCAISLSVAFESIDDALKNGVSKGDLIFYGNFIGGVNGTQRVVSNKNAGLASYGYLGNMGYFLGNVGLGYTSGFYKNFRASVSFRAMASFYDSKKGAGNVKEDFFNSNQAALAESFIEYFDGDTNVKVGRIDIKNEWVNTLTDAIWVRNRSLENLLIEGFWAYDFGRIDYYAMTHFVRPSQAGVYYLGAKYYFLDDRLTLKAYTYFAPPIFTAVGGNLQADFDIGEKFTLQARTGGAYSFEHKNALQIVQASGKNDGGVFYLQGNFSMKNAFEIAAGYVLTGYKAGFGSLGLLGEDISPFFVWGGRVLKTQPNANLIYGKISAKLKRFNFFVAYGGTFYDALESSTGANGIATLNRIKSTQNEVDAGFEIWFSDNVIGVVNVVNTHLDSRGVPTLTQVNGGLRLAF
ncbi:hypothetical protein [Helicobacter sp. T3_23-1059]